MTDKRLESWKAIAAYLERQVRTVQGWEKNEGLPVHRQQHQKSASVFAYAHELDAWLAQRTAAEPLPVDPAAPTPPRPRGRVYSYAGAGLLLLVAGLVAWRLARPSPAPAPPVSAAARYFAQATSQSGRLRTLPVPAGADMLQIRPDGQRLFAASYAGSIEAFATRTNTLVGQWHVPPPLSSLAVAPDGRRLYVLNGYTWLTTINLATGGEQNIQFTDRTAGMTLAPDGRFLYVAFPYAGVDRIDTRTWQQNHWILPACPQALAAAPDGERLAVSFQCGGPGGTDGHDAVALLEASTGQILSQFAGPPRIGSPLTVSPDGNEVWSNSDGGCVAPQFDHHGCPYVPASLLQVFAGHSLRLLHTLAIPARAGLSQFGAIAFLPGGERVLDGNFLLSSTRYARLEALPPDFGNVTSAAVTRDGAHLYTALHHDGRSVIADFRPTPAVCSPPTAGLADWWPGDGTSDDIWGVIPAQPSPTMTFAPGQVGQAFDFTPPGAQLTLGPDPGLNFPLRNLTLTAWVKFSTAGSAAILDKPESWSLERNARDRLELCTTGHEVRDCLASTAAYGEAQWLHVAVAADARGAVRLYVDGQPASAPRLVPNVPPAQTALYVGADPAAHVFLRGWLDELMLYRRTLRPEEIRQLAAMPACLAAHSTP